MAPIPDTANMTDDELRQQLMDLGATVGPIVSTTRLFYEKKLVKLIQTEGQPQQSEESEGDYDDDEEEEEDDEVQLNYNAPPRKPSPPRQQRQPVDASPPRQRVQPMEVTQTRQRPQSAAHTPITQARRAEPTLYSSINTPQSAAARKPTSEKTQPSKKSGGGVGMWIKLLLILVLAGLVYLVIVNMNPSADNKIPSFIDNSGV